MNSKQFKILVVDDEIGILEAVKDLLEDDYQVTTCNDAHEAIELLKRQGDFAVVLTDQRMPNLTGDAFLATIRDFSPAVRILFTAYSDQQALVRAVNNGNIYGYLSKPWDPREFKNMIARATQHFALTETLSRERRHLGALMDNSPDHIFFKDKNLKYIRVNNALAKALGLKDPGEATGKSAGDFLDPECAADVKAVEENLLQTGEPYSDVVSYGGDIGPLRWASVIKVAIKDHRNSIVGIIGISRDISDLKHAESSLRRQAMDLQTFNEELKRSNVELEQFAYVASHDLQEPLRMVSNFTQLLARSLNGHLEGKRKEYVHFIVDGANRMTKLIDGLLTFSRVGKQSAPFKSVDSQDLVKQAMRNLKQKIKESGAVVTYNNLPAIDCNPVLFAQVFQNLIGNAIKFRKDQDCKIHIDAEEQENAWLFSVTDNGIGIEPRFAERIFVIFQRLNPQDEYEGTGIGLSLCKRIIQQHQGKIWVESEVGQGSTFLFTIPKTIHTAQDSRQIRQHDMLHRGNY